MTRFRLYVLPALVLAVLVLWLLVPDLGFAQARVSPGDITTRGCALQNTLIDALLRLFGATLFTIGLLVGGLLAAMRGMAGAGAGAAGPAGSVIAFFAEHSAAALVISLVGVFGGLVITALSLIGC